MRKLFVVALLVVFAVGITGLLTVAESVDENDVVEEFSNPSKSLDNINDYLDEGEKLDEDDLDGVEKVLVVSPEGIEDGNYEVKNKDSNGKVLIIVDPIHVTE